MNILSSAYQSPFHFLASNVSSRFTAQQEKVSLVALAALTCVFLIAMTYLYFKKVTPLKSSNSLADPKAPAATLLAKAPKDPAVIKPTEDSKSLSAKVEPLESPKSVADPKASAAIQLAKAPKDPVPIKLPEGSESLSAIELPEEDICYLSRRPNRFNFQNSDQRRNRYMHHPDLVDNFTSDKWAEAPKDATLIKLSEDSEDLSVIELPDENAYDFGRRPKQFNFQNDGLSYSDSDPVPPLLFPYLTPTDLDLKKNPEVENADLKPLSET